MFKISNFSLMFIGYESFYCNTVQIMQFLILDFDLDHYGSESFNYHPSTPSKFHLTSKS